jgi:hypothetical protein
MTAPTTFDMNAAIATVQSTGSANITTLAGTIGAEALAVINDSTLEPEDQAHILAAMLAAVKQIRSSARTSTGRDVVVRRGDLVPAIGSATGNSSPERDNAISAIDTHVRAGKFGWAGVQLVVDTLLVPISELPIDAEQIARMQVMRHVANGEDGYTVNVATRQLTVQEDLNIRDRELAAANVVADEFPGLTMDPQRDRKVTAMKVIATGGVSLTPSGDLDLGHTSLPLVDLNPVLTDLARFSVAYGGDIVLTDGMTDPQQADFRRLLNK